MNVGRGRKAVEKDTPRHGHVVERIARSDETFIANEPMHAIPWNSAAPRVACQELVKHLRGRSPGQANGNATSIRIQSSHQAFSGCLRQRRRIVERDWL